jgi:hypothetical protein
MKMARITNGVVGDVIVPIEGFTFQECFHPDILAQYVPVAGDVQPGWVLTEDGIVAPEVEPIAPEPKAEEVAEEPVVEGKV